MSSVLSMINEIDGTVSHENGEKRALTLRKVVDLFLADAPMLTEEQVDVFDVVIARLANEIETRARIELSERLADISNAPKGIIRNLAHDEIIVARSILERSNRLTDEDMVAVALAKGKEHMLALSERSVLTEPVTEVLVSRGDRSVIHKVAQNQGARFSEGTLIKLVDRSRHDKILHSTMTGRKDISDVHVRQLVNIAKEAARLRISEGMSQDQKQAVGFALERSAVQVQAEVAEIPNYAQAMELVSALAEQNNLNEKELRNFANSRAMGETVCTIGFMAGLSVSTVERLFTGAEIDLILVVGKSEGWSWETLKALIELRKSNESEAHKLVRVKETYEQLSRSTAQRVMHFLKVREATQKKTDEAVAMRHLGGKA
jgi:uncharacterized protein (DUF2336 family)